MAKKSNAGRPTVMTKDVLDKLEEVFLIGGTDEEACLFADIATDTLYKYQRENPEFIKRKEQLKETPILAARRTLVKSVSESSDMALKYLSRKRKDEFSERHNLAIGGDKDTLGELTDFFRAVANPKKDNGQSNPTGTGG